MRRWVDLRQEMGAALGPRVPWTEPGVDRSVPQPSVRCGSLFKPGLLRLGLETVDAMRVVGAVGEVAAPTA